MKNITYTKIIRNLVFAGFMANSFSVNAAFINDIFLFSADIASGDALETSALQSWLDINDPGVTAVLDLKVLTPSPTLVALQGDTFDQWVINVTPDEPGFFMLKFGTGSFPSGTPDHYYFKNIDVLTQLVWTDSQVNNLSGSGTTNGNIGRLSHYSLYNGGGGGGNQGNAPEPNVIALFGMGLVAIGLSSIRRKRKAH